MKEYKREYFLFSLCGLNCGLCPRFHTDGSSKCPGCGGNDFHLKHPSCVVITCNKKHDNVEFCFQCSSYPCERYIERSNKDSFISYQHVENDMKSARENFNAFKTVLEDKIKILESLINYYNDGRRKNFYCLAVNLLSIEDLKVAMKKIHNEIAVQDINLKDKVDSIINIFTEMAEKKQIQLVLRK